jgi:hypothetical protein
MTDPGVDDRLVDRRALIVAAVIVLAVFTAVGYVVGADVTERRHNLGGWHTGTAHVGSHVITIEYDGWAYGADGSVETWIDSKGELHGAGWPACLRLGPGGTPIHDVPIRFAAHEVSLDGTTWRPILGIDCRGFPTQR